MNRKLRVEALGALATACLLVFVGAAKCDGGPGEQPRTIKRLQHQVPDGKDIKVERWCVHYSRPSDDKVKIDCTLPKETWSKLKVGQNYP